MAARAGHVGVVSELLADRGFTARCRQQRPPLPDGRPGPDQLDRSLIAALQHARHLRRTLSLLRLLAPLSGGSGDGGGNGGGGDGGGRALRMVLASGLRRRRPVGDSTELAQSPLGNPVALAALAAFALGRCACWLLAARLGWRVTLVGVAAGCTALAREASRALSALTAEARRWWRRWARWWPVLLLRVVRALWLSTLAAPAAAVFWLLGRAGITWLDPNRGRGRRCGRIQGRRRRAVHHRAGASPLGPPTIMYRRGGLAMEWPGFTGP